jgi:hypothetical protein
LEIAKFPKIHQNHYDFHSFGDLARSPISGFGKLLQNQYKLAQIPVGNPSYNAAFRHYPDLVKCFKNQYKITKPHVGSPLYIAGFRHYPDLVNASKHKENKSKRNMERNVNMQCSHFHHFESRRQ